MKKTLVILLLLSATAAFAQYSTRGSISNDPQFIQFATHPEHASYAPMAAEQSIIGNSSATFAQGDRPVSDFPQAPQVSLGEAARQLKKQHAQVKKARVVWEN
jgi:hypothetical protein